MKHSWQITGFPRHGALGNRGGNEGVFRKMEQWCQIRQRVLREGVSIRQIQRETGLHFETIKKILAHSLPPEFQCPERLQPKLGAYLERIS